MSYYMGCVRNEAGMDIALERLGFIATYKGRVKASNMHELMMVHEAEHLLSSCVLSTLCTRERRESGRSVYSPISLDDILSEYLLRISSVWRFVFIIVGKPDDSLVFTIL